MSRKRLDRVLVVDFEETCWEGPPPEGERPEIIEIGLSEIAFDRRDPEIVRTGRFLVRPQFSTISEFCTGLTGITPQMAHKQGRPLQEVVGTVQKKFGGQAKTWVAWGRDDKDIARDCSALDIQSPFSDSYIDLGQLYGAMTGATKAIGLSTALDEFDLEFQGCKHSGEDDAFNTARLFIRLSMAFRSSMKRAPDDSSGLKI